MKYHAYVHVRTRGCFRNFTVLLSLCPWDDAKIQTLYADSKFFMKKMQGKS